MATITEDYVSFETAKLLKEKGFDGVSTIMYKENGKMCINPKSVVSWRLKYWYPCLTLQMAMKWLREVHKLEIIPFHEMFQGNSWWYRIERNTSLSLITEYEEDSIYGSYEQAAEAAIKYCLKNLI